MKGTVLAHCEHKMFITNLKATLRQDIWLRPGNCKLAGHLPPSHSPVPHPTHTPECLSGSCLAHGLSVHFWPGSTLRLPLPHSRVSGLFCVTDTAHDAGNVMAAGQPPSPCGACRQHCQAGDHAAKSDNLTLSPRPRLVTWEH